MAKFKIGDRVIVTDTGYKSDHLQNGQCGTIVSGNSLYWDVLMDTGERADYTGIGWAFYESQIELLGSHNLKGDL